MSKTSIYNLDETDNTILQILQQEGRLSNVELAQRINLSAPATHTRVRKLEQDGLITKYVALISPEMVGYHIQCFVNVAFQARTPNDISDIFATLSSFPEVQECHSVTGDFDCILKIFVSDQDDLNTFLTEKLVNVSGIARTQTQLVLKQIKYDTAIAL
jgi:DNA-binding Lrp family transcriptional regulator